MTIYRTVLVRISQVGLLAGVAAPALAGCPSQPDLPEARWHRADGWTLAWERPDFRVKGMREGLRIEPEGGETMRQPLEVELTLEAKAPEIPAPVRRTSVGRSPIHYGAWSREGGSGGEAHHATGWLACGDGFVVARLVQTVEAPGKPSHDLLLEILVRVRCPHPR